MCWDGFLNQNQPIDSAEEGEIYSLEGASKQASNETGSMDAGFGVSAELDLNP